MRQRAASMLGKMISTEGPDPMWRIRNKNGSTHSIVEDALAEDDEDEAKLDENEVVYSLGQILARRGERERAENERREPSAF